MVSTLLRYRKDNHSTIICPFAPLYLLNLDNEYLKRPLALSRCGAASLGVKLRCDIPISSNLLAIQLGRLQAK